MVSVTIYIVLGLLTVLYFYLTRIYKYWESKGISCDKPVLLFGNIFNVAIGKEHLFRRISRIYEQFPDLPYVGMYVLTKPMLVVRSPDLLKRILVKDFDKFADRAIAANETVDPLSYHTLFTAKSRNWRALRTKISPVFTSGKMKMMLPLMQECGENFSKYLKKHVGTTVQFRDVAKKYAVDVISSCAFGIEAHCLKDEDKSEILQVSTKLIDFNSIIRNVSMFCFFFAPKLVDIFRLTFVDMDAANYLFDVFKTTMKKREESKIKRNDLIDLLYNLKANEKSSDEYQFDDMKMASQAISFFSAGNDTTATIVSFTLYELAINKEVQKKLREELTQIFEKYSGFSYEAIHECKYLEMVVNETLRKYPLTTFLNRAALDDYVVEETGYKIDKGTVIIVPICGLQNDPKYFPGPEKFDPERFSDENKMNITPYTYLPFGDGPRNCIGQRFGLLAIKVALAYTVKDFAFEPDESTKIPLEFLTKALFLQNVGGIKLKVVSNSND